MDLSKTLIVAAVCFAACNIGSTGPAFAQTAASATPISGEHGRAEGQTVCEVAQAAMALPQDVRESSGLARSGLDPARFWTHNDAGNAPDIFALDEAGQLLARVRITGASLVDWEDIAAAPCTSGSCLFIGDIGDNDSERDHVIVYRVPEPAGGADASEAAIALHARFPDGPRDAEALFVDASGSLYIVNKGRGEDIALYRYPAPHRPGETVTLERVRGLFPQPADELELVTAAAATPDGRWVGVRTYRTLYLYRTDALLSGDDGTSPIVVDLSALGEAQGESLVLADNGDAWVSSEAENDGDEPSWARLRCSWPD